MTKRGLLTLGGVALALLMGVGCSSNTTPGTAVPVGGVDSSRMPQADTPPSGATGPAPPAPAEPVAAGKIGSLLLSAQQIDEIVGATLGDRTDSQAPPDPTAVDKKPQCAVLFGMNAESLGNGEFTAYRQASQHESGDDPDHVVTQRVATYSSSDTAGQVFRDAFKSVRGCDSAVLRDKANEPKFKWQFQFNNPVGASVMKWRMRQLTDDKLVAWLCSHEARVKNNVILHVRTCQYGNGAPMAATVADQISAQFPPADPPAPPTPQLVTPGKIVSLFVPVGELGGMVGASLGSEKTFVLPALPGDLGDKSACQLSLGLYEDAYGKDVDWTAFRDIEYRESADAFDHIVDQQAATYPDAETAARQFNDAFKPVSGCDSAVVHLETSEPNADWKIQVPNVSGDTARWSNIFLLDGKPNTWRCAFEARVKDNVILQVQVCQWGNAAEVTSAIADRMVDWLPK
jgi:hypothetical protein